MTIHTHNHALTYTHIYVHRHAQHEHSTYTSSQHHIPKHHLTHHNFTSHATRSIVYLRLHTFTLLPPNLTSHENNITSHTHIHIRITSACTSHILQTASYTRYTYRQHTTKVTHLYMHIHTYTQTHPPSPLHHSHTSSSLVAFLCSV